jgi:integrase
VTLDEYLDEWFALQRTRLEPSTWHNYRTMAAIYLRPALGPTPLAELTSRQLDLHYVRLLEDGGRGGRPLARRTVAYAHAILRKALGDAVADGLLDASPAERAEVPRVDPRFDDTPRRLRTWDADQVAHFLRHPRDRELHDLWRVALGTGMRRGELLGLRWEDLDLDVPQLRVAAALTSAGGAAPAEGHQDPQGPDAAPRRRHGGGPGATAAPAAGALSAGVHPARRRSMAARGGHGPLASAVAGPRAALREVATTTSGTPTPPCCCRRGCRSRW